MKKLFALFLFILIAISICSCGKAGSDPVDPATSATQPADLTDQIEYIDIVPSSLGITGEEIVQYLPWDELYEHSLDEEAQEWVDLSASTTFASFDDSLFPDFTYVSSYTTYTPLFWWCTSADTSGYATKAMQCDLDAMDSWETLRNLMCTTSTLADSVLAVKCDDDYHATIALANNINPELIILVAYNGEIIYDATTAMSVAEPIPYTIINSSEYVRSGRTCIGYRVEISDSATEDDMRAVFSELASNDSYYLHTVWFYGLASDVDLVGSYTVGMIEEETEGSTPVFTACSLDPETIEHFRNAD